MNQKDRVFTPTFVANLFLIAGIVFLFLKGKINAYVGYDGAMHDGTALLLIGVALVCIGVGIWIMLWIKRRMNHFRTKNILSYSVVKNVPNNI